jgi:hypothetical protein
MAKLSSFCPAPVRAALTLALLCAAPAWGADDVADGGGLRLGGFGTLGVSHTEVSQPWRFRRDTEQPGDNGGALGVGIDTRLGLQANWRVDPHWGFVGQAVAQRRASTAKPLDHVEWAFVAFEPVPDFTVRAGRTSLDLFLMVDYRNVGFAYPWVRPSMEFYSWVPNRVDGIDAAKVWNLGDTRWRLKGTVGRVELPRETAHDQPPFQATADSVFGTSLSREQGSLTVKASAAFAHARPSRLPASLGPATQALAGVAALQLPTVSAEAAQLKDSVDIGRFVARYAVLSAAYETGAWRWQGEVARVTSGIDLLNYDTAYGAVAYRCNDITWFGMLGQVRTLVPLAPRPTDWAAGLTPLVGSAQAQALQGLGEAVSAQANSARQNQTSLSLGLRWDFDAQMALKLQYDHTRIRANGGGLWADATVEPAHANALAATLDFVF